MIELAGGEGDRLSEAELTAKLTDEIVPREWEQFCKSPDQILWLNRIRDSFALRLQALSAYFRGEEIPMDGLSRKGRKALLAWLDYWTAYYDLLQASWNTIKQTKFRTEAGKFYRISDEITPGRLLLHLIHLCAAAKFYESQLKFYNFSGFKIKALLQAREDLLNAKRVSPQKINEIAVAEQQTTREFSSFFSLQLDILDYCGKVAQKDWRVRRKLENVLKHQEIIRNHITKNAHKFKSYQWIKGMLKSATQGGGYG